MRDSDVVYDAVISFNRPYFARRGDTSSLRTAERRDIGLARSGADLASIGGHSPQPRLVVITGDGPDAPPALAPQQLTITRRTQAGEITLTLRGELDLASASALEDELHDAEASRPRCIVLDLEALEFIGSTGIHLFVEAQERAETDAHRFVLTHVPAYVLRLLRLTGVDALLAIE